MSSERIVYCPRDLYVLVLSFQYIFYMIRTLFIIDGVLCSERQGAHDKGDFVRITVTCKLQVTIFIEGLRISQIL